MHNQNQNVKAAKIGIVLTDSEDWTASAYLKNIRKRYANALLTLSTLNASLSISDLFIFKTDLKDLKLAAFLVRDVGISFSLEQSPLV